MSSGGRRHRATSTSRRRTATDRTRPRRARARSSPSARPCRRDTAGTVQETASPLPSGGGGGGGRGLTGGTDRRRRRPARAPSRRSRSRRRGGDDRHEDEPPPIDAGENAQLCVGAAVGRRLAPIQPPKLSVTSWDLRGERSASSREMASRRYAEVLGLAAPNTVRRAAQPVEADDRPRNRASCGAAPGREDSTVADARSRRRAQSAQVLEQPAIDALPGLGLDARSRLRPAALGLPLAREHRSGCAPDPHQREAAPRELESSETRPRSGAAGRGR